MLPEYYEKPQFYNRPQPRAELPPFNPQPLIDTFLTTQTLNAGMQFTEDSVGNVPYAVSYIGRFAFNFTADLLIGDHAASAVGMFSFGGVSSFDLTGIEDSSEIGGFGLATGAYGIGSYGESPYGGSTFAGFDVGFYMVGIESFSATGAFAEGIGYGDDGYGDNVYREY